MTDPLFPSRRGVLTAGAGLAASGLLAACSSGSSSPKPAAGSGTASIPGIGEDAFALGIASGDPLPGGVLLWTRLAPKPLQPDGGVTAASVPVDWEVAEDERFSRIVARGRETATPALAHSVHADARGLAPGRDYFYRFRAGTAMSPIGRTRTAPAAGARVDRLRIGVANCQNWEEGLWPAYRGLAAEDVDVVLHLGDYIYEYSPKPGAIRATTTPERPELDQLVTLTDYRIRHSSYKSDEALRMAHAAFPWMAVWDDHDVENNYAGLVDAPEDTGAKHSDPTAFAKQRAAAYQAYYEHMPIRVGGGVGTPDVRIYRRMVFGDLMTLHLLDTRQYRTPHPCNAEDYAPATCGTGNTTGTMTGAEQEAWLKSGLAAATTRWNALGQQTMMGQVRGQLNGQGPLLTLVDQNDGYVPYRSRILTYLRDTQNPVVLSGDIHSAWVNDLRVDFDRPETPVVAPEFVTAAISSKFDIISTAFVKSQNERYSPHVRYFDGDHRGYSLHTVTPNSWDAELKIAENVTSPTAPVRTASRWTVPAGQRRAQQA